MCFYSNYQTNKGFSFVNFHRKNDFFVSSKEKMMLFDLGLKKAALKGSFL